MSVFTGGLACIQVAATPGFSGGCVSRRPASSCNRQELGFQRCTKFIYHAHAKLGAGRPVLDSIQRLRDLAPPILHPTLPHQGERKQRAGPLAFTCLSPERIYINCTHSRLTGCKRSGHLFFPVTQEGGEVRVPKRP